jgi:hypothetical protein
MKPRLTYANVVSTIALFGVIAGGTAVALPGKKTVEANDLKKNAVKAAAIAKKAVRSAEIKDGAVTGADVADEGLGYEDLGSNSVVARIRSTAPFNTGNATEADPVVIPLSGNQWTQQANEIDVLFGEIVYTQPPVCTNGFLEVEMRLDGQVVDSEGFNVSTPNALVTDPLARIRPYAFEPGTDTPRTLELRAWDECDNAGENFQVQEVALNVVAIR